MQTQSTHQGKNVIIPELEALYKQHETLYQEMIQDEKQINAQMQNIETTLNSLIS